MRRKKPPAAPAPPLDWLRQSVWAGEELPEELALLEAQDLESESAPAPKPRRKRSAAAKAAAPRRR